MQKENFPNMQTIGGDFSTNYNIQSLGVGLGGFLTLVMTDENAGQENDLYSSISNVAIGSARHFNHTTRWQFVHRRRRFVLALANSSHCHVIIASFVIY